jgi:hypothetical protein
MLRFNRYVTKLNKDTNIFSHINQKKPYHIDAKTWHTLNSTEIENEPYLTPTFLLLSLYSLQENITLFVFRWKDS